MVNRGRPHPDEYAPAHEAYVAKVAGEDVIAVLGKQLAEFPGRFAALKESDAELRYAPGKWTLKEVLGHINDCERIFSYRALRIARADQTPMEGFEQDDYVRSGPFAACRLSDLVDEFTHIRRATLGLFRPLDEAAWRRRGVANKAEVSVRGLAYVIAGHVQHHAALLEERYFPALAR
ncbi:MAG TPA: DinB family protein [Methylomirabilota bacterium]|nr:DinB family protein [Methylomirabilota bacterium]